MFNLKNNIMEAHEYLLIILVLVIFYYQKPIRYWLGSLIKDEGLQEW